MSVSSAYKPSPLGPGSPSLRTSPFRRPESPASPSPLRYGTPNASPTKSTAPTPKGPPPLGLPVTPTSVRESWAARDQASTAAMDTSQTKAASARSATAAAPLPGHSSALSRLQPTQMRALRDGFQILDRDCDGLVNRDDVADMLNQLGNPSDIAKFFPAGQPQSIALAAFLHSLAEALSALSPSAELLSAFSAFDDDDSGQADWADLKSALLHTAPEPSERTLSAAEVERVVHGYTGRRAFNRNMAAQLGAKKGEVFRYQEFVNSMGSTGSASEGETRGGQD